MCVCVCVCLTGWRGCSYWLQLRRYVPPKHNHIATAAEVEAGGEDWVTYTDTLQETFCLVSDLRYNTGYQFRVSVPKGPSFRAGPAAGRKGLCG